MGGGVMLKTAIILWGVGLVVYAVIVHRRRQRFYDEHRKRKR
jgi:hypothetical protein